MARDSHLDKLGEVPLFSACSRKDLQKIAKASDEVEVKAGRVLVDQGKTGHEFFLILDGNATVRANNRKVANLGPGDYFGELSLLSREPRDASVTADTRSEERRVGKGCGSRRAEAGEKNHHMDE